MDKKFKKNFMNIEFSSDRNLDLLKDSFQFSSENQNEQQSSSTHDEYKRQEVKLTQTQQFLKNQIAQQESQIQQKEMQVIGPKPKFSDSDDDSDSSEEQENNYQQQQNNLIQNQTNENDKNLIENNQQTENQEENTQNQELQIQYEKTGSQQEQEEIERSNDQKIGQQEGEEELDDYSDNSSSSNHEENKARDDNEYEDDDDLEQKLKNNQLQELKENQKQALVAIPCSHEVLLKGHTKSITSLTLEKSGARIITGSNDQQIRMWDFNGMNKSMNSFRILTPIPGCVIKNVSLSVDQQEILVVANSLQPKVISKEGKNISQCLKGDMYLKDMAQTKGHTQLVNDGTFSPADNSLFITCSNDCTIRMFDRSQKLYGIEQQMAHKLLIKCKDQRGMKTPISAVNFTQDGKLIFGVCEDGSLQGFNWKKGVFNRPDLSAVGAHQQGCDASKIISFNDNNRIITRSLDHTMKIWDIRQIKKPLNVWYNLPNYLPGSKVCLSQDEKYIVTGTSVGNTPQEKFSKLFFYDAVTFDQVADINFGASSVTDLAWHNQLNQIFVGSSDNMVHILFDPKKSKNGALLCLNKQVRKPQPDDFDFNYQNIITPHALPLFKEPKRNKKKLYEQTRLDPEKSKRPQLPQKGPRGEQKGGSSTVMQHYMRNIFKNVAKRDDPQKSLLALDTIAKQNPQYISNAYTETQPEQIFDYTPDNAEQQLLSSIQKICPACGLKICSCQKKFNQK